MTFNLLFVNGSRGEWGYIKPIIDLCIQRDIAYSICLTNMVLLDKYGSLRDEIIEQGYRVCDEIFMAVEGDNHTAMSKSLGLFLISFSETMRRIRPTWIVLAGDRGEQLMASIAGAYTYTPTAHIQAGERSGNIDGVSRHSIGKFAHLHFASNTDASERLIKLGEEPSRIHLVGAPQIDDMYSASIPDSSSTLQSLGIPNKSYLLVVFHPITDSIDSLEEDTCTLMSALSQFPHNKIFIMPNNDAGTSLVRESILRKRDTSVFLFSNLTRLNYLSLLRSTEAIIGNSSSGLLEAPSYAVPAVNIGHRQANRVYGDNVIHCPCNYSDIVSSISIAISPEFRSTLSSAENPYGDGRSSHRILDILCNTIIDSSLLVKHLTY